MSKIELTERELILVWGIVTWFNRPGLASGVLVTKFYPGDMGEKAYRFDTEIENRIIEIADFLIRKREHDEDHAKDSKETVQSSAESTASSELRNPAPGRTGE